MGYITEKLTQLLRGVRVTSLKERREAKVAVIKEVKGVKD